MGNVLASMIVVMIGLTCRYLAEQAQRQAKQSAREVHELAEQIRRQAYQDREAAQRHQGGMNRADRVTLQIEETLNAMREAERMRAQMEVVMSAVHRAHKLSEAAANAAWEDAMRLPREAQEESKYFQRTREQAATATIGGGEGQQAEEMRKAIEAKEEAERYLKEGSQPIVTPTPAEFATAKKRIQYREDCFHFAVAGVSGSGKSSLVNAFRSVRVEDTGAAAVGVTDTTLQMARYADANPDNPVVWYDIPGAGTIKCRDWQYFNDQGLYVFDCIIVLFDNRFTMTDIAILMNARRFNIPTYIVRSKADQHIRNIMMEIEYEEDEEEDVERRNRLYEVAEKQFIDLTRESVQANLKDANLPDQRVYIVSNNTMLSIMRHKTPKKIIDEVDLLNDVLNEARSGRGTRANGVHPGWNLR